MVVLDGTGRHHDHHAEQEQQRGMIDGLDGFVDGEHVETHHSAGTDDGRARTVGAEARQPADGERNLESEIQDNG